MTLIQNIQHDNYFWKFDQDCFNDINADQFRAEYWQNKNAVIGNESGRGTTWFIKHNEHELVLRHYLRGGMIRHLSRDQYLFKSLETTRSFAEFELLAKLSERGFAVPKPAAAQVLKQGLAYRADIFTHRIPNSQDLVRVLQTQQSSAFYRQLGEFIASFHTQGVFHADLNIQNILQDKDGKFWLIDFDRAQIVTPHIKWQKVTLNRLKRSFEKEKVRYGIKWLEMDWNSLIQSYNYQLG